MNVRFRDAVDALEYDELVKVKKDLRHGAIHIRRLVEDKIKEKEIEHKKFCSICGEVIHPNSTRNYTLLFGPEGFKKKATFCALDCMEYFLKQLKGMDGMENRFKDEE
ncbi:hypothetical protein HQ529_06070 [Candidatus Woesearchaeota archaeon]|nr:hypothetical protein [Candidatus Woesearchaeota archaeon]